MEHKLGLVKKMVENVKARPAMGVVYQKSFLYQAIANFFIDYLVSKGRTIEAANLKHKFRGVRVSVAMPTERRRIDDILLNDTILLQEYFRLLNGRYEANSSDINLSDFSHIWTYLEYDGEVYRVRSSDVSHYLSSGYAIFDMDCDNLKLERDGVVVSLNLFPAERSSVVVVKNHHEYKDGKRIVFDPYKIYIPNVILSMDLGSINSEVVIGHDLNIGYGCDVDIEWNGVAILPDDYRIIDAPKYIKQDGRKVKLDWSNILVYGAPYYVEHIPDGYELDEIVDGMAKFVKRGYDVSIHKEVPAWDLSAIRLKAFIGDDLSEASIITLRFVSNFEELKTIDVEISV